MREIGSSTKLVEMENSSILMVMSMTGSGSTIRQMDSVCIAMSKEQGIKEIGKRTNNMVKVSRHGLKELSTKVTTI